MSKALTIFSGGQDSTTCLYWAKERYDEVLSLTFNYNQRHAREIESAKIIAKMAGVAHEVIDMGSIFAGLSPLTDPTQTVDTYASPQDLPGGLEKTFVPGRNILFLCVAANRAYVTGCDDLIIGVSEEDFGGYPDCRLDFVEKMEEALASGLDKRIAIKTPLIDLTKKKTVELAQTLKGCMEALAHSTTCYNGDMPPCGQCHSCLLRKKGFEQAGVDDPLLAKVLLDAR
jgi:7-cyano-7-deazaguanine synthase